MCVCVCVCVCLLIIGKFKKKKKEKKINEQRKKEGQKKNAPFRFSCFFFPPPLSPQLEIKVLIAHGRRQLDEFVSMTKMANSSGTAAAAASSSSSGQKKSSCSNPGHKH